METKQSLFLSIARVGEGTLILLLIPLAGTLLSGDVTWTFSDFFIAGIMLFGTGSAYVVLRRQSGSSRYKLAAGLMLASALFLTWANMAVGIIGSEDNLINLFYFLVVLLLIIGSIVTRFKPRGMAFTLFTTALAQAALIPAALFTGMQSSPGSSVSEIIFLNGLFITLFLLSGILFWQDDENRTSNQSSI